ncbi:MAG: GDSL-type esterase/lipase family protein, partial [Calditrichaeota bacterium]|nr:GDSL-type esterase/lipase family protein [Calditrichota bacterium]
VRISDAADGLPVATSDAPFSVQVPLGTMDIVINTDDEYELFVNGVLIGSDNQWNVAQSYTVDLVSGKNVIAVHGINGGGSAGLIIEVRIDGDLVLQTDSGWLMNLSEASGWTAAGFDDSGWANATDVGQYGIAPWNSNIANFPSSSTAHWIWSGNSTDLNTYFRGSFSVGPPQITSFSPTSALVGSEVIITGSNFGPAGGSSGQGTVRIMLLGDSITKGLNGSTDNAGYRNDLAQLLDSEGISYDFVGTLSNGSGFDNDHEGHNGFWADEILAEIDSYLNANPADMVLFHIGTNDISSDQSNASTIDEIGQNLDQIRQFDTNIVTILASIVPRKDSKDGTTNNLNSLISDLVNQRQAAGDNVFYAPINETFKSNSNWADDYYPSTDNVHPNDNGYAVMAGVWFDAIRSVLGSASSIAVAFNGTPANGVVVDSDSQVRATVPVGVTTGKITVTNPYGGTQSAADFTVLSSTVTALELFDRSDKTPWPAGSAQTVRWKSLGEVVEVDLDYSADGGETWQMLAEGYPNSGRYVFNVPVGRSERLSIRVSDSQNKRVQSILDVRTSRAGETALDALPNLDEMRRAIFGKTGTNMKLIKRTDFDGSGGVDVVDFVNRLDLNDDDLRNLSAAAQLRDKSVQNTDLRLVLPGLKLNGGKRAQIPIQLEGEAEIRGFQLRLTFDGSRIRFDRSELPDRNEFGMTIEAELAENSLTLIGYLEKENSAVLIRDQLLSLPAELLSDFDDATVQLTDVLLVSKSRTPLTDIEIENTNATPGIPTEFALFQNYPNPFNPSTQINFNLPKKSMVTIRIYNLRGELVHTLVEKEVEPGKHKIVWNGKNQNGIPVASGVYFYRIKAGQWHDSRTMTLLK